MTDRPHLHVALLEPKIPQNTGNIGRLVLGMGGRLHLVGRLGFRTDERACRRAGLDYWPHLDWRCHEDLDALRADLPQAGRVIAFSTRAERLYTEVEYLPGDCLLFGDELTGLPAAVLDATWTQPARIPIRSEQVRSFNLANAVAIGVSEASRQFSRIPVEALCRQT